MNIYKIFFKLHALAFFLCTFFKIDLWNIQIFTTY